MHRRTLLASVAAGVTGLAGCLGDSGTSNASTPAGNATATDAETPTFTFEYTTVPRNEPLSVEAGPVATPNLEWTVEKLAPATEDHPCRLRIAVENAGSRRDLTVSGALPFPIVPGRRTDGGSDMNEPTPAVVPTDSDHDCHTTGYCWFAALDNQQLADDAPWSWGYGREETHTLGPGERVADTYHVLSSVSHRCFAPGEYRFGREYELDGRTFTWSFFLRVPSYGRDV